MTASEPIVPLLTRSRTAVTRCDTGLMSTNHCNHEGIVFAGTKAFETKVSGNSTSIEMPWTLEALRAMTPKNAKIQLIAHEHTITSTPAVITAPRPPSGRKPTV